MEFDHYTLSRGSSGEIEVIGWSTYPDHSVLAGQPMKVYLDCFGSEAEARKAYPEAGEFSSRWTEPQPALDHLPGEDEPEDRPSASFMSARECAIDEQAALCDDPYDDY